MLLKRIFLLYMLGLALGVLVFSFMGEKSAREAAAYRDSPTTDASSLSDTAHYVTLSDNILAGAGMSLRRAPPYSPTSSHVPGYPYFLATAARAGLGLSGILLLQIAWAAATGPLTYVLARSMLRERAAMVAAILTVTIPMHATLANSILTESVFLPLLLASLVCLVSAGKHGKISAALAAGAFLGLATLTRAISQPLIPILTLLLFIWPRKVSMRARLAPAMVFAAAAVLIISPWLLHNKKIFGQSFLTTASRYNFFRYNYGTFLAHESGLSLASAQTRAIENFSSSHGITRPLDLEDFRHPSLAYPAFSFALREVGERPVSYALLQTRHSLWFFGSNFIFENLAYWGAIPRSWAYQTISLRHLWNQGSVVAIARELAAHTDILARYLVSALLFFAFHLMALGRAVYLIFNKKTSAAMRMPALLLFTIVLFFIAATSFTYEWRFQYPALPLMLTLALSWYETRIPKRA